MGLRDQNNGKKVGINGSRIYHVTTLMFIRLVYPPSPQINHVFDKNALVIIINALVFSKLFYCSSVWSNTTQTNLDKLQAVQNFAYRTVSGAGKLDHTTL